MPREFVTLTASLIIHQEGSYANGYVVTSTREQYRVASLMLCGEALSDEWREEFRGLCKHIVEERLDAQGMRLNWVTPQAPHLQAG
jgi:hypothetical protein